MWYGKGENNGPNEECYVGQDWKDGGGSGGPRSTTVAVNLTDTQKAEYEAKKREAAEKEAGQLFMFEDTTTNTHKKCVKKS